MYAKRFSILENFSFLIAAQDFIQLSLSHILGFEILDLVTEIAEDVPDFKVGDRILFSLNRNRFYNTFNLF